MGFRENFKEKLRYSHFLRLVLDAIAKIGLRITPYYVVQEGIFGRGFPSLEGERDGYRIRFLVEGDMKAMSGLRGGSVPQEQLNQRLKDGHCCIGLMYGDEMVAFNWANPNESSGDLSRFPLHKDEAYLYDMYTIPAYRGKRLAPYLRYQSYRHLSRKGMTRLYSISDALNTPSIKFKKRLSARFVKLGVSIKLLNRREYNIVLRQLPEFKRRLMNSDQST